MRLRSGALLVAALHALSCASDSERPRPPTCVGDCGLDPGLGVGVSPNPGDNGGADGEGGSSANADGVELSGQVLMLNDDLNFATGSVLTDEVDLKTEGASGRTVTGLWNGTDPFVITKVKVAAPVWLLGVPRNPVADDALPAVEPVRTDNAGSDGKVHADFALVHATTMDHVFDLATVPLTRDPLKAQVILRLVQKSSGSLTPPISGVTVSVPNAEDVLYAVSGGFSDVATGTDATGIVVLANVPAAVWPGAQINIEFSGAKKSGGSVQAVTGSVTLATLVP